MAMTSGDNATGADNQQETEGMNLRDPQRLYARHVMRLSGST